MTNSHVSRRRALTKAAQLFAATGATLALTGVAGRRTRFRQKIAGYQDQPSGQHRCGICAHFLSPNSCQIVDGEISPDGWCKLFAPEMD